jgi:glycosyltransferase involved in cell wall biosynthesis
VLRNGLILQQHGWRELRQYRRRLHEPRDRALAFPNGITTSLAPTVARNWGLLHRHSVVIVAFGPPIDGLSEWIERVRETLLCHVLVSAEQAERLHGASGLYSACSVVGAREDMSFRAVKEFIHQNQRNCDVLFLDLSNPLPVPTEVVRLQHAAYTYDGDRETRIVAPALRYEGEVISGFDFDPRSLSWEPSGNSEADHGQRSIPRYTLSAPIHGLYVAARAIDRVPLTTRGGDMESELADFLVHAWRQNVRTLTYSPVILDVASKPAIPFTETHRRWLSGRAVTDSHGRPRVIYVLNATSVSGGIRTVFEQAMGLRDRGLAVEIWSLEGQPTWTDLDIEVKQYANYSDLLISLRNEEAIKIATWWETCHIVWLASVNTGIPVNFVQEFETWFYPEDPLARAVVVSSYRKEFRYITIADYQLEELAGIGIAAELIPVGYEPSYFHEIPEWPRSDNSVLAVGRSFFQKNFSMTADAWRSLGDDRPTLLLFGYEPELVQDDRVDYRSSPSHQQVNQLYNTATCFILTSRHEGFGLPLIEAMAAGCPVITTDTHGNRGFCIDGETALIVPQDDRAALADAIRRVLNEPGLRATLRRNGLEMARRYQWPVIVGRLGRFYRSLV